MDNLAGWICFGALENTRPFASLFSAFAIVDVPTTSFAPNRQLVSAEVGSNKQLFDIR